MVANVIQIDKKIVGWSVKQDERIDDIEYHSAPKRPEVLDCEIYQSRVKSEQWTILVGLLNNRPYEIIGGLSEFVEIPRKYKKGTITKRPRKTRAIYDLRYGTSEDDTHVIKDIVSIFDNPNHSAFTRMISLSLRHGAPIQYICEQLQKDKDSDMYSFARVMSRVLKNYIEDGTETSMKCDECGSSNMQYTGGCPSCLDCGFSKCG